jgi:hypothetical protein
MPFTATDAADFIKWLILQDETMGQQDSQGVPLADRWLMKSLKPSQETDGASLGRGLRRFAGSGDGRLMPRWVIPMLYTLASVTAGLILRGWSTHISPVTRKISQSARRSPSFRPSAPA